MALSKDLKFRLVHALADQTTANEMEALLNAAGNAQGVAVASVTAPDATDTDTTEDLANANKVAINALLVSLRNAGIIAP